MLLFNNVTKSFNTNGVNRTVLDRMDLKIEEGEFIILFGRSGCGKTTVLNILGLLDDISSGEYLINDTNAETLSGKKKAEYRNRMFGFIFQSFHLISDISASDNIELPMIYSGTDKTERNNRAVELLKSVGMENRGKEYPNRMSGGEKQRIAIARALANNPPYILADEPTGNLDEKNRDLIIELLLKINREHGNAIVMVTHDRDLLKYADRIIAM